MDYLLDGKVSLVACGMCHYDAPECDIMSGETLSHW